MSQRTAHKRLKPPGYGALSVTYACYRKGAKKRGLVFDITREQFEEISAKPCHYCGRSRVNKTTYQFHKKAEISLDGGSAFYNGIDRVKNDQGYILSNVVPCCKHCNWSKKALSYEDFLSWVVLVYRNLNLSTRPTNENLIH